MKILALETSAKSVSCAVVEDGAPLASAYQCTGLTHSRTLLPMVDAMLKNADLTLDDINAIAIAAGPGSFTGLRIGIAAVKGLAWAADKPCLGVSTLEAMAQNAAHIDGLIVGAMDARRSQVYNAVFEAKGGEVVDQESYSEGDVDFKTQLTSILGMNPEVIFCPNYYEEVGQILSQAESVGLTVPFLGGDGWDGLEGYATADQLKDSYFCANYAKGASPEFEEAYKAEYGEEYPNGFAPLGYDAATTVVYGLQAAEDAGLEAGTDEYKQAVIDAIAGGTITGLTGTFTFDEHHDPVKSTAILTYVDGKPELKEMF